MPKPKKLIDIYPPKKIPSVKISAFLEKEALKSPEKEVLVSASKKEKKAGKKKIFFITCALSAVLGALLSHFVFSKVEIEIWPETEMLVLEEKITVDPTAGYNDLAAKILPGLIFEEERSASQEFSSSGESVKESYAKGVIRVYNNYKSSQTMVARTRFQPPLEKVLYFRAIKKIVVPSKSYVDAEVRADAPGEEYNIGPSTFSIPGLTGQPQYYSIYGKSFSPMTGGYLGKIKQVSKEDLAQAQELLLEKIKKETADYLKGKISKDSILPAEGIIQEVISANGVEAGVETEKFTYTLQVKSKAVVFKKDDLENFANDFIAKQIQGTGRKVQSESLKIDYSDVSQSKETGRLSLTLKISAKTYQDIDLDELTKSLPGKTLKEVKLVLEEQPKIVKVKLRVFPFWLESLPGREKIRVRLNID